MKTDEERVSCLQLTVYKAAIQIQDNPGTGGFISCGSLSSVLLLWICCFLLKLFVSGKHDIKRDGVKIIHFWK